MAMFSAYPTVKVSSVQDSYDYIIVGGGTAGCVLANRLSQNVGLSVLILERGGVQDTWISRVPLFSSHFASDGSRSWVTRSTPQVHVDDRQIDIIGGNCLGGSSRINAMLYTRGLPAEFNAWTKSGNWDYASLEPCFIKSETNLDSVHGVAKGYSGTKGEWLHRSHKHLHWVHSEHIIKATSSFGIPYVDDPNSPHQPAHGCAKIHYSIDQWGRRSSTFSAFLPRKLANSRAHRLHICPDTLVRSIELASGPKNRFLKAEGVWIQAMNGAPKLIRARKEIVLCAGPIGSPHLLLLSGIGPKRHLSEQGIDVRKDLPGVGYHLQDHLSVPIQFRVPVSDSLAKIELRPWVLLKELILYLVFGLGLLLSPVLELSIFVQSCLLDENFRVPSHSQQDMDGSKPENRPDIEIMPIAWGDVSKHRQGGLTLFSVLLRPTSMGTVRLTSSDPTLAPAIDPNWLATPHDVAIHRDGVRFALRLKAQMVEQGYPIADHDTPGSDSDHDIDAFVRAKCLSTYHYSSTCRMGPEDADGVVDEELKVHGVEGLRIADSSIFPEVLSTHLAAATVSVAEKCAGLLQGFRHY